MAEIKDYNDEISRIRTRSARRKFFDSGRLEDIVLRGREKFRTETFYTVLDSLISDITARSAVYDKIYDLFGFISQLEDL